MTTIEKPTLPVYQMAAFHLHCGDLVAFPTETVYGLGADAFNEEAIRKIFSAKGRPDDNPLIVHIEKLSQLDRLIEGPVSENALILAKAFWPGPLTMIFQKSGCVPDAVTAGLRTVAVRIPGHMVAQGLLNVFGRPIAAPSANLSGRPSPTTAGHVLDDLDGWLPMIIDGGACEVGLESTVIDMTCTPPRVLRPGGVTVEMIEAAIGPVEVDPSALRESADEDGPARSPGTKHAHYAPKGHMELVVGEPAAVREKIAALYDAAVAEGRKAAILMSGRDKTRYGDRRAFALGDGAEDAARRMFAVLREMDDSGVEEIFTEPFECSGIGLAVMNRLLRASGFCVVEV